MIQQPVLQPSTQFLATAQIYLVFSTSVENQFQANRLAPYLNALAGEDNWNFDLTDNDHILRVNASAVSSVSICALLQNYGFSCNELTD